MLKQSTVSELEGTAAHPGVGEQVIDQVPHSLRAVDHEVDELVRLRVEAAAVALGEQLHEPGDRFEAAR